jgi:hypothetical protein
LGAVRETSHYSVVNYQSARPGFSSSNFFSRLRWLFERAVGGDFFTTPNVPPKSTSGTLSGGLRDS